ncbi:MAG: hypothetical protein LRY74_02195, partial [Shewanella xiamenensis]|nr:hypothetical protein [Shewanella xiamenensis]
MKAEFFEKYDFLEADHYRFKSGFKVIKLEIIANKKGLTNVRPFYVMVPEARLELARCYQRGILNPLCL